MWKLAPFCEVLPQLQCVCVPCCAVLCCQELGASGLSKRPTSCMLILPKPPKGGADDEEAKEFAEAYSEVEKKLKTTA